MGLVLVTLIKRARSATFRAAPRHATPTHMSTLQAGQSAVPLTNKRSCLFSNNLDWIKRELPSRVWRRPRFLFEPTDRARARRGANMYESKQVSRGLIHLGPSELNSFYVTVFCPFRIRDFCRCSREWSPQELPPRPRAQSASRLGECSASYKAQTLA